MHKGLREWIEHGIVPGSFLAAILRNDLKGAIGNADATNRHLIPNYVEYLYNFAPGSCWGSPEHMARWLETKKGERDGKKVSETRNVGSMGEVI